MAAVLGGVQSMFTAAWDEPFALPTEESTTLALRTQQILAYETGVARVADPLGGSYFVEALTDATEARIIEIMDDLERHGGMVSAIEDGYLQGLIADEAFRMHQEIEARHPPGRRGQPVRLRGAGAGRRHLRARRRGPRSAAQAARPRSRPKEIRPQCNPRLAALARAAEGTDNLMHKLIDCANAYCTVGEMVSALKAVWGEFQQPVVF